ncbi:transmembrane protein 161A [Latimeria chalumnae]|uniref:Transmembrane protein 161A n=1 Tax=Latimeria chalumnae TaxID=7897 RepID=H3AT58_LATCH|nr:PREDICTED: transmembrane protein 161A [Latimeria chalumnae]|eukprot:XP_006004005.1 PREDICTED: transmembrane protein 161A [Latimeria chalumnae]
MAVMGIQLVVSLLMASIMQKMAPHCSFARWLLCNGSLFRYKHPSEEELRALAGKQKPKTKKDRRQNGATENKPLSVPKDIDLHLETKPITTMDALVLRYFLEYQWLIDFAIYATGVYLFTEGYYCLADAQKEVNIGAIWCLLTVAFAIKVLFTLLAQYFSSEEGGESSVCLAFGFFFLVIAMVVLIIREDYLEFGLDSGFASVLENLEVFLKQQGWEWSVPFTRLGFKLILVGLSAFIGACLTFPGLRLAQTHLDALRMTADQPMIQVLLHLSFLSPVMVVLMWVKPVARDFLMKAPLGKESVQLMSSSTYNSVRLWTIVVLCLLRFAMTRYHLQAYLNLANRWVDQMKREAGRITTIEIQRKVTRVFCYLTVITLQYLGPILLTLHSTFLLKSLGNYSWGLAPESPGISPGMDADPPPSEGEDDDIQATVAQITSAFGALRGVFTPLFYRGLFSFLTWWVAACQIITSLFGIYFHQYLMPS